MTTLACRGSAAALLRVHDVDWRGVLLLWDVQREGQRQGAWAQGRVAGLRLRGGVIGPSV